MISSDGNNNNKKKTVKCQIYYKK